MVETIEKPGVRSLRYLEELQRRRAAVIRMEEQLLADKEEVKVTTENLKHVQEALDNWLREADDVIAKTQLELFGSEGRDAG